MLKEDGIQKSWKTKRDFGHLWVNINYYIHIHQMKSHVNLESFQLTDQTLWSFSLYSGLYCPGMICTRWMFTYFKFGLYYIPLLQFVWQKYISYGFMVWRLEEIESGMRFWGWRCRFFYKFWCWIMVIKLGTHTHTCRYFYVIFLCIYIYIYMSRERFRCFFLDAFFKEILQD